MMVTLYHGTTPEGAAGIRADGYIRGGDCIFGTSERGVSLTSKRSVAEGYGPVVIEVRVDTDALFVDPESNDNASVDEALRTGAAVYVIGDVVV